MIFLELDQLGVEGLEQLQSFPGIMSGESPDPHGIKPAFVSGFTEYLLDKIYEAYKVKSLGGIDELGNSWDENRPPKQRIMRVTDRLLESFRPWTRGDIQYFAGPDQYFEMWGQKVFFGSEVPYSEYAQARGPGRPIIPDNWQDWMGEAVAAGMKRVGERLEMLNL